MTIPRIILSLLGISILSAFIFIPDWFENPRELAPGEWQDAGRKGKVEVDENAVHLLGFGPEEPIRYEWLQTDDEPYTMQLTYGSYTVVANITFNGRDEVIAELDVMDKLPSTAADMLRKKNRNAGRPENEFRLLFRRVQPKK